VELQGGGDDPLALSLVEMGSNPAGLGGAVMWVSRETWDELSRELNRIGNRLKTLEETTAAINVRQNDEVYPVRVPIRAAVQALADEAKLTYHDEKPPVPATVVPARRRR